MTPHRRVWGGLHLANTTKLLILITLCCNRGSHRGAILLDRGWHETRR